MEPNPPPPPPPPPPSSPPPPSFAAEPPSSWWDLNKKWAIPVGCVGLFVVAGCCGLMGVALFGANQAISFGKEQVAAAEAVRAEATARIQASPEIKAAVGEPVTVVGLQQPNYQYENGRRRYGFVIPVNGPKGEVTVHGEASTPDAKSPLKLRTLEFDDGEKTVDLLEQDPQQQAE